MPKRGNWGDRMGIIVPVLYKRVSCATCINYCHEDHSCLVTAIVPRVDGFDSWKKCKKFDLSQEYCDEKHKNQVFREKGEKFLIDRITTLKDMIPNAGVDNKGEKESADKVKMTDVISSVPKTFAERFTLTAQKKHNLSFGEITMPELLIMKHSRCFINNDNKIVVITLPKIKEKRSHRRVDKEFFKINRWSCFSEGLKSIIRILQELQNAEAFEKWIVIPVIPYEDDMSCGEVFYRTRGKELNGIKLVEMDEDDQLLFATGPIFEKFWTAEKIKNARIFKG